MLVKTMPKIHANSSIQSGRKFLALKHVALTHSVPSKQQGIALIFALVALATVTLLGISNARNSLFQMQSASAFTKYLQTDAMAESAVSCVINKVKNGEIDFGAWITETYLSIDAGVGFSNDPDAEQGVKTETDLNSAAAAKSVNSSRDCLEGDTAQEVVSSASSDDEFSAALRIVTGDGVTSAKDVTYVCGWSVTTGNELGTYANFNLATAGEGMVSRDRGAKTINVTVWQAFGPVPSELYDEVSGGFEFQNVGKSDSICEV